MPEMWKLRFEWTGNETPPEQHTLDLVEEAEDAIPQLVNALQNDVVPNLNPKGWHHQISLGRRPARHARLR